MLRPPFSWTTAARRAWSSVAVIVLTVGCSSTAPGGRSATGTGPTCVVSAIPVVVSIDQWGDIVAQLAGSCGEVTTVFASTSADPHTYESTAADNAKFGRAKLVVVNGLGYDPWADRAIDALAAKPAVVNGGRTVGLDDGANPHLWYSPNYVDQIAAAVTSELTRVAPAAAGYFEERARSWRESMKPYRDKVATIRATASAKRYGATEPVFDYMARAVGLTDATPPGYQNAAANRSDPAPGDVNAFQRALRNHDIDVLVFNTQTQGAVPDLLRVGANDAAVPTVAITESVPPGTRSFAQWQVAQLDALDKALTSAGPR